jgi:hypothetical protein
VHLFRLENDVEENDVKDYMRGKKVPFRAVQKVSREGAYFNSFRVEVAMSYKSTIMAPDFWPEGACVKRFFFPRGTRPSAASGRSAAAAAEGSAISQSLRALEGARAASSEEDRTENNGDQ